MASAKDNSSKIHRGERERMLLLARSGNTRLVPKSSQ